MSSVQQTSQKWHVNSKPSQSSLLLWLKAAKSLTKCKTGHLQIESQECLLFTKHLVHPILGPRAPLTSTSYLRLNVTQAGRKGDVQSHDQSPARGRGWDFRLQQACTLAGLGRYITRARKRSRKPLESGELVGCQDVKTSKGHGF